jgi:NAD(P)-dependent dehydrogenase (short-subunit alcohol dehydrogenase family)
MDFGLQGKRALVTGSTAGIGLAIARALAAEGAHVIVNGRTASRVMQAVEALKQDFPGATAEGVSLDLGTAPGCEALIAQVPEVDILVNNLGIFEPKPFEQIPDEDWMRFFEVNVLSGIRLSRHYMAGMRSRNWGRILFISSESGLQIPTEMIHYGMTKTAQIAVARGLAETLAGTGVTVTACCPARPPPKGSANSSRNWRQARARTLPPWSANSSLPRAQRHLSSASQRRKKWPQWWLICAARRPRPRLARPYAWMAAWCAPLPSTRL